MSKLVNAMKFLIYVMLTQAYGQEHWVLFQVVQYAHFLVKFVVTAWFCQKGISQTHILIK